uniref:Glabrous enhancer-binding protein-like DBD domain-containing protein n=1 Tax=Cannabis sativa TaxID=3483 RepID=A0A803QK02_CANSA
MAPRRLKEAPPPADSSSDESDSESEAGIEEENGVAAEADNGERSSQHEEDDDEEEDDDDDEEEEEKEKLSLTNTKEESDSGSDSETDSDSVSDDTAPPSPTTADFTIKPSKSIDDSVQSKVKKPTKANASTPAPASTPPPKRAAEKDLDGNNSKKKKGTAEEDLKQVSSHQRLWSDDDEIEILKGLIDYQSKKGKDPTADMSAFLDFIKKNLHVDVEKRQLSTKISRLKKKYFSNAEKVEKGEILSKPHDRKSFELSKKIWGSINGHGSDDSGKSTKNKSKQIVSNDSEVKTNPNEADDFSSKYPCLTDSLKLVSSISENLLNQALPLMASSKLKELENKWRKLHMEGMELQNKRNELTYEQSKLILKLL